MPLWQGSEPPFVFRLARAVRQGGGPTTNYNGSIEIVTESGGQLLLPGDEVLLVGSPYGQTSGVYTFFPVGRYTIRDGDVYAVAGNPCNTLDGLAVAEVSRIIAAFVQQGSVDRHLTAACDWSRFDSSVPSPTPRPEG